MNDPLKKHIDKNRAEFETKEPPKFMWEQIKSNVPNLKDEKKSDRNIIKLKDFKSIKPIYYTSAASIIVLIITFWRFNTQNQLQIDVNKTIVNVDPKNKNINNSEENKGLKNTEETSLDYVEAVNESNSFNDLAVNVPKENKIISNESITYDLIRDSLSVSNRIKGIALLKDFKNISNQDLNLLKELSLNDNNSIVRLNALELLTENLPKEKVSDELTNLFIQQNDAMVQLELINMIKLVNPEFENQKLIKKLQEIILDSKSSPFIKDEAYVVLLEKNIL